MTEQIFVLRNIIEQVSKWNSNLYICFVDFEKAFDSMHRDIMETSEELRNPRQARQPD